MTFNLAVALLFLAVLTDVHGTVFPEISLLLYLNNDPCKIAILIKFHESFEYGSSGCISKIGIVPGLTQDLRTVPC